MRKNGEPLVTPHGDVSGFQCETVLDDPTCPTMKVKGILDEMAIEPMKKIIDTILAHPVPKLFLDLRDLTFMSSAGLTVLLNLHRRLHDVKGVLVLKNPRPAILRILTLTRLDRTIPIEFDPSHEPTG